MNKTKIEWCDYTWNPVTGCLNGCEYCYAKKIVQRFQGWTDDDGWTHYDVLLHKDEPIRVLDHPLYVAYENTKGKFPQAPYPFGFKPTFYRYRLNEPKQVKHPAKIFVCSMADLFGDWVPAEWINEVIEVAKECPQHTFMFLTKNPGRYFEFEFPENCWLGASTGDKPDDKTSTNPDGTFIVSNVHSVADIMRFLPRSFISFEPLRCDAAADLSLDCISWVIIGAQTGPGAILPKKEWIQDIIDVAREDGVPVFMKNNLKEVWDKELIQKWPVLV
ncbi:DUF5131 family protein [Mahella australiensis]|uniref:Gp37Gp68 family protein n=1 Tax=Mahella australiensis (strain DSM 15567 / CIP 107919 / 50-1 BON) TaxID=697281 RepID=F3ZWZ8_MAHA5|nr:DUF5131 family protein [Mahella australiensis]AEE97620.1 Gp37Gp68 family protein [Mahella australiensis 50-1 BON]